MKIKEFEEKYDIKSTGFTYDTVLAYSQKLKSLLPLFNEDGTKNEGLTRVDFGNDFINLFY